MIIITIIWSWLILCATSVAIVIEVDNTNGIDTKSCYSTDGGTCRRLDYAINGLTSIKTTSSITIKIHRGVYNIDFQNLTFFDYLNGTTIYGAGFNLTKINCSFGSGLAFFNVKQLVLSNFTICGGGRIMNSTSINTTSGDVAVFRVALYLQDCKDVTIDGVVVTDSTGTGLVMHDVTGNVTISNSTFQFNKPKEDKHLSDGGVSILITTCRPHEILPCSGNRTISYNIQNCFFYDNIAMLPNNTLSLDLNRTFYHPFGHGGGLSFTTKGTTHIDDITLSVKDCNFIKNHAMWGGGLSIRLHGEPSERRIILSNVLFDSNYLPHAEYTNVTVAGTGGGGVKIEIIPNSGSVDSLDTIITFNDCTFQNNSAMFGGGVAIELVREEPVFTTIHFTNCTWKHNIARLGSALYVIVPPYPFGKVANLTIDSCRFMNNTNHYTDSSVQLIGIGTLYSWSVPVIFIGKNNFTANYGSALVGIDVWFTFNNGAVVVFENNTAENGGAITLFESSFLRLFENVQLNFTYNEASIKGGAIHVDINGQSDLVGRYCFLFFYNTSVSPYEWKQKNVNVTIYFAHNKAKYGNSIFANSLYPCVSGKLLGLNQIDLNEVRQACYWNRSVLYKDVDVSDLSQEISTEVRYVQNVKDSDYSIPPGKLYTFNFTNENERKENMDAVFFVTTTDSSVAYVDNTETLSSNNLTLLHGKPQQNFSLQMVTVNRALLSVSLKVKLANCPPGYYLSSTSNSNDSICKCSVNVPGEDYFGIIECDVTKLVAYLRPSHYAGYIDGNETLLTAGCQTGFCYNSNSNQYLQLPPTSSPEALDNLICKPKNRRGTLCGKCSEGKYIYVNSYNYECGNCTNSWVEGTFKLIGLKYVPLAIFLYIIGLFGISLVNGPLNSVVLFGQLLPYMDIYAGGRINILNQYAVNGYLFLYGIWNLNFFEQLTPDFCVLRIQSALEMVLFNNLIPVVIGIMLSYLYILISEREGIAANLTIPRSPRRQNEVPALEEFPPPEGQNRVATPISSVWKCVSYIFCCICCKCSCLSGCVMKYKDAIGWLNRTFCFHDDEQSQPPTCFSSQGLITCVVLCYAKLTALAFDLLSNTTLYGPGKDKSHASTRVFLLDGTKHYVEDAIWALVVGIICIILVSLIPLIIMLYPVFHNVYNNQKRTVNSYIYHFYDSIRLCYQGNRIACFFTAVYFCYRIGALAIYAFVKPVHYQYLWQCGFFSSMLLIHCIVQPYRKRIYNIIDGIVFFNLILISLLSMYRLYAVDVGLDETDQAFSFQLILIYLPFVYIVLIYPCFVCYKKIKARAQYWDEKKFISKLIKFIDDNLLKDDGRQDDGRQDDGRQDNGEMSKYISMEVSELVSGTYHNRPNERNRLIN